ncbi:hypothetical protein NB663_22090, partial [Vibrio parahaemolyticus]|uniref:hypothetical protein n=1 Tax=Vibrio parahaemolyticus TaxID=670 RepID=UPI00215C337D
YGGADIDKMGSCVRLSSSLMPNPDTYDSSAKLNAYHRGFIFSGVKVKAKHLRSQMDLLKITPIPNKKGSPFGEPFLFLSILRFVSTFK